MTDQPRQPAPPRKRRWPRRVLVVVFVLAALYGISRYTLHRMVEAKHDAIRKAGYPVTFTEVDKLYPPPPPGKNAADLYEKAFTLYVKPDEKGGKAKVLPVVGAANTPSRVEPLSDEMKIAIAGFLSENKD